MKNITKKLISKIVAAMMLLFSFAITLKAQNTSYGTGALADNSSGTSNSAFGFAALGKNTTGSYNNAFGLGSLYVNTSGSSNSAYGFGSLYSNTTGSENTAIGTQSLSINTTGINNIGIGAYSLFNNSTASCNTATGYRSLYFNSTGIGNTANGYKSLYSNSTGYFNTANGYNSLTGNLGSHNTASGTNSLSGNVSGNYNTAIGSNSLALNTSGDYNTAIGLYSLLANTIGGSNTGLGYYANVSAANLNNATAIGANAVVNASNKIRLGDANVTVVEGPVPYTVVSDGRFKNNIAENDVKGLEFIKRLRPVVYNFDTKKFQGFVTKNMHDSIRSKHMDKDFSHSSAARHSGFIAQEVEKAANEAGYKFNGVHTPSNDDDYYSLSYSQFVVPLVKGMQEQQKQIEQQQQQITELKKLIAALGNASQATGASDNSSQLKVFPNPTSGTFNINTNNIDIGTIEVYSISGTKIHSIGLIKGTYDYKIDLSGYSKGMYTVNVVTHDKRISSKIIFE